MNYPALAIDPTLNNMGYAVVLEDNTIVECGVIRPPSETKAWKVEEEAVNPGRLISFKSARKASQVFAQLSHVAIRHGVKTICSECPGGAMDANAAVSLEKAIGGVLCLSRALSIPIYLITPGEVKRMTVGYANASKQEMQEWAYKNIGIPPHIKTAKDLEHVADALAVFWVIKRYWKNNSRIIFLG
jgi:Holliday junction resolvasome RuvABC endonuclease subunit